MVYFEVVLHAPARYPNTFESPQAEQAFPYVFNSVAGQGVVTQRTPVSRVAQTGLYSRVQICGRGSLHFLYEASPCSDFSGLLAQLISNIRDAIKNSADIRFLIIGLYYDCNHSNAAASSSKYFTSAGVNQPATLAAHSCHGLVPNIAIRSN